MHIGVDVQLGPFNPCSFLQEHEYISDSFSSVLKILPHNHNTHVCLPFHLNSFPLIPFT